jgi:hypothetical protein
MKKLIHLKSFDEFDPAQWELDGQNPQEAVQEADRVAQAFATATGSKGNIFDDDDESKWGRTSKTDKWGEKESKAKPAKEKKEKKPGRISMMYKDAKAQAWKGYKSELHPGMQKLRKYIKGRDSYFD